MTIVRRAEPGDLQALLDLGSAVPEFAVSGGVVNFWPRDRLADAIAGSATIVLVASDSRILEGLLVISWNSDLRKAIIENIVVAPPLRGRGIGRQLLRAGLEELEKRGCEYVCTLVPEGAAPWYEEQGFSRGETFRWMDLTRHAEYRA